MKKSECSKCSIVEYGVDKNEVPLCSRCKKEFMEIYHRCIMKLEYDDVDKRAYIRAMIAYASIKK